MRTSEKNLVIAIVGPTATGKSNAAIELAALINGAIISADSMLVYKHMDIGTAKPTMEQRKTVEHYLIDIAEPSEEFSVARYQQLAREKIGEIKSKSKIPIIVGGTGLYIRAALDSFTLPPKDASESVRSKLELRAKNEGINKLYEELLRLDPEAEKIIDSQNERRIIRALEVIELTGQPFSSNRKAYEEKKSIYDTKYFGLNLPREKLYDRINQRVDLMVKNGLAEETKALMKLGFENSITAKQALGYKEILEFIYNRSTLSDSIEKIKQRTRNYAKRQITWFKADPRINWIEIENKTTMQVAEEIYKKLKTRSVQEKNE